MSFRYAVGHRVNLFGYILKRSAFLAALLATCLPMSLHAKDKMTNFRLGIGSNTLAITGTQSVLQQLDSTGLTLVAEYPQDKYTGSRFLVHYQNDSDSEIFGYETQLMLGWGLDAPGFRIHTGPLWHRDHNTIKIHSTSVKRKTTGWGWHLGIGYQQADWVFELASSIRENGDYDNLNKDLGVQQRPNVSHYRVLVSRRF